MFQYGGNILSRTPDGKWKVTLANEAGRKALLADQWANLGRTFFELPLSDRLTLASGRVEIEGREQLEALARADEGTVFISGHFSRVTLIL